MQEATSYFADMSLHAWLGCLFETCWVFYLRRWHLNFKLKRLEKTRLPSILPSNPFCFTIFTHVNEGIYQEHMDSMSTDGVTFLCLEAQASHSILAQNVNGSSGIPPVLFCFKTHWSCSYHESESDVTYGQVWWPILGICALHLTHPKCTHTAVNTHTPWTHTRSSGQPFMLRRPGSSWGFGALLKGTAVMVLRVERALYIHSPHLQFLHNLWVTSLTL